MTILMDSLLTLAGTLLFYLSSPNQQWLKQSLAQPFRAAAYILLACSWFFWMSHLDAKAGFFAALVLTMLLLGSFPMLSLLRQAEIEPTQHNSRHSEKH